MKKSVMIQYGNLRNATDSAVGYRNSSELKSRKNGVSTKATITDDTKMSKEAYFAMIEESYQSVREGKCTIVHTKEELLAHLDSL